MSKYTTELRYICESLAGLSESKGYNSVADVIEQARPKIFNFTYELFDPNHKAELETKILKHYYGQEIGLETYGLWHLELDKRMNEIMPYYNKLYESASLEFNPLDDVNYTKTHAGTHNEDETESVENSLTGQNSRNVQSSETGESSSTETNDGVNRSMFSDTPQGKVNDADVEGNAYLTSVTKDTNNSTVTDDRESERNVTSNDTSSYTDSRNISRQNGKEGANEFTETMKGKVGTYSYAKLLKDYREQILNIDLMIINDLQDLFMLLW
jgi:hypothetical protein